MKKICNKPWKSLLAMAVMALSACGGNPDGTSVPGLSGANTIKSVAPFTVTTVAGTGDPGDTNGPAATAQFNHPAAVAVDGSGNVYVADSDNHVIRKISVGGVVSTYAGQVGQAGYADGSSDTAMFSGPTGLALDLDGNLYVADIGNYRIRKVTPAGEVSTYAGSGTYSAHVEDYQDGPALQTGLYSPQGLALDVAGNLYFTDGDVVRKISTGGGILTLAGDALPVTGGGGGFADCDVGSCAKFDMPGQIAFDKAGNVYVADTVNQRIRKITPAGAVSTLAGSGVQGFADGTGADAMFDHPFGLVVDSKDNLYVADQNNRVIRKITLEGTVTTVAGQPGVAGNAQGVGSQAQFYVPSGLAIDKNDTIYIADYGNHNIRKMVLK
jgi:sugar lactone lactonase YvrE